MQRRSLATLVVVASSLLGISGCTADSAERLSNAPMSSVVNGSVPPATDTATSARVTHICWIDTVQLDGANVRVRFVANAPVGPGQLGVRLEPGATFSPANSGHDGCRITALRRDGTLGVQAESHFFDWATMTRPQIRSEWIVAES